MVTWNEIYKIYQEYQVKKGIFKKLFRFDSSAMNWLHQFLLDKNLDSSLSYQDTTNFIEQLLNHFPNNPNKLSYQLILRIGNVCTNQDVFKALKHLYDLNLYHDNLTQLILHDQIIDAAKIIVEVSEELKARGRKDITAVFGQIANRSETLACCLGNLLEEIQEWNHARKWYEKGIESKNPRAMYYFACLLDEDRTRDRIIVISKNENQAIYWCQRAITYLDFSEFKKLRQKPEDLFLLAKAYEESPHFPSHMKYAMLCYHEAAEFNHPRSIFALAGLYQADHQHSERDLKKSFSFCQKAIKLGYLQAWALIKNLEKMSDCDLRKEINEFYLRKKEHNPASFWSHRNVPALINDCSSNSFDFR